MEKCVMEKCVMEKCVMEECVMEKCVMEECVMEKCVMAKCVMEKCVMEECVMDTRHKSVHVTYMDEGLHETQLRVMSHTWMSARDVHPSHTFANAPYLDRTHTCACNNSYVCTVRG